MIPTISPYLLPSVTPALRRRFERLSLVWVEDKTEVLVASLEAGSLDAAVLALEAELGDVEHEIIAKDPFVLVAASAHPLAEKTTRVAEAELRGENVLLLDDGHCLREQALDVCASAKARELEFRATSLPTLVQMVAGGAGVTLLPELSLATELRRGELVARPFRDPVPHRTIALVWRRRSPLATALRDLARVMRQAYPAAKRERRRPGR